jgi:periplasmic divalent cation tolerance protein
VQVVLLYVTASHEEEAAAIGRALVAEKLCACANVISPMRSIYRWEGKLAEEREAVLIVKTREDRVEAVTARVGELHSYTLPCVVALPVMGGSAAFLDWVVAESGPAD